MKLLLKLNSWGNYIDEAYQLESLLGTSERGLPVTATKTAAVIAWPCQDLRAKDVFSARIHEDHVNAECETTETYSSGLSVTSKPSARASAL